MKINFQKDKIIEFIKKRKTEIVIILVLIAIIAVVSILLINRSKNMAGNSISNLQNKAIATANGNIAYYTKMGKKTAIYKLNLGTDKETKIKNTEGYYLNLYKDYLYYLEQDEETKSFNIIKSKLDGSERENLVKEVDNNRITVVNGWAYYFKDKVLFRIKTNAKDNMKVIEDTILNYGICNNYIYYIYNNGEKNVLARRNLNDGTLLKLAENVSKDFEIIGNNIYFIEQKYNLEQYQYNYSLYKMKMDGKNRKQILLLPNGIENVNITKNAIFYALENESLYNIYKLKYKESEPVSLAETKIKPYIAVVGKWIFYLDLNDNQELETYRIKGE